MSNSSIGLVDLGYMELSPKQIEVKPEEDDEVTIELGVNSNKSLPDYVAVGINGKAVDLKHRGGGMYRASVNPSTLKLPSAQELREHGNVGTGFVAQQAAPFGGKVSWKCKVKAIKCPPDCKSIFFGTRCRICFKIDCDFGSPDTFAK